MTEVHHVYAVQNILNRGHVSDDKDFSNAFIAHLLKLNRALLIKQEQIRKKRIHSSNKQLICVPLVQSSFADCPGCDLPILDCHFYRSVERLPSAVVLKAQMAYTIRTIDGDVLDSMTVINSKYNSFNPSKTKGSNKGWFMSDGYLYIIWPDDKDHLGIELVLAEFVAEDPSEITNLSLCEDEATGNCVQELSEEFPIDTHLIPSLYKLTLEMLGYSYKYPEDDLNNAVSADQAKSAE